MGRIIETNPSNGQMTMNIDGSDPKIVIDDVIVDGGRIEYDYSSNIERFFREDFVVEYDVDVSNVPESILMIPCVANLCPIAWATGADLYVPALDAEFLDALPAVRQGLETLHPEIIQESTIYTAERVNNSERKSKGRSGILFSNGVDSTTTYLRHRNENPCLLSFQGFDFLRDNEDVWENRKSELRKFSADHGLDHRFGRMNMYSFLDLTVVNAHFARYYDDDDDWITSVHHGLGLLGVCAPLTIIENIDTMYIAATHSEGFTGAWGSHPIVDNRVKWANTTVEHDAYEWSRQEKLYHLAEYVRRDAPDLTLRTCLRTGYNCSRCEKCARTEIGLLLTGLDPANHGYNFDADTIEYVRTQLERGNWRLGADERWMWKDIQRHIDLDQEFPYSNANSFFAWLQDVDIDEIARRSTKDRKNSVGKRAMYAVLRNSPDVFYSLLSSTRPILKYVRP